MEGDGAIGKTPIPFRVPVTGEVKVHGLVTSSVWLDGLSTLPYLFEHKIGSDDRVGVAHQVAEQAVGPE